MKRTWIFAAIGVTALGGIVAACKTSRAGYESAPYTTVRKDGRFEIREYPALTLVETPMPGRSEKSSNGSFGRLFRFISGGNDRKEKIAMTTPVFMAGEAEGATMAFVLPANTKPDGAPKPSDENLKIREVPAGKFAVLRFDGSRSEKKEAAAAETLKVWITKQGLQSEGGPVFGYFDPPWTPAFLLRNEVMFRLNP